MKRLTMLLVDSYFQLYSILFVEKFPFKPSLELLKQFVDQEKSLNGILHIPKGGMKVRGEMEFNENRRIFF